VPAITALWVGLVGSPLQRVVAHIFASPDFCPGSCQCLYNAMRNFLRDSLALASGQKGMSSSGSAFLLHRLHAAAVRTVKYVEVRQLLKAFNVPNELHRSTAMRACRGFGLHSVGHG
jgi:hypothetical protein